MAPLESEFDVEMAGNVNEMANVVTKAYHRNADMVYQALLDQLTTSLPSRQPNKYQDEHLCVDEAWNRIGSRMKKIGVLLPTRSQYFPNSVGGPTETASLHYYSYQGDHSVVDKFSTVDDDNFSQVGDFYRKTLDAAARERLTDNIAGGGSLVNECI
ncbi:hypothetical protein F444_08787 [Phytophthora nicotianae P1976]|uniref:Catalase immune-responsive domain-containing protein n=2 Tax=Phytophthora nicotianae TaxID=4792 RepID=A0A081A9U5_PHYNI|nr:hypothetical protein F444_08787 [Phytophthora nicotianae P1976]